MKLLGVILLLIDLFAVYGGYNNALENGVSSPLLHALGLYKNIFYNIGYHMPAIVGVLLICLSNKKKKNQ